MTGAPKYTEDCTVRDSDSIWSDDDGKIHIMINGTETVYKMDPDTALDIAGHLLDFAIEGLRRELKDERSRTNAVLDQLAEAQDREAALQAQLDKLTDGGF